MYFFNSVTKELVYVSAMGSITVMKPANAPSPEEEAFVEAIQAHKEKENGGPVPTKRAYKKKEKPASELVVTRAGGKTRITDEMLDQARELIEGGMSYREAAGKVGMGVSNLYARLPKS